MHRVSRDKAYYASETIALELRLRHRAEAVDVSKVGIVLEIVTGQLGPRRYAASLLDSAGEPTTPGVRITRGNFAYRITFLPEFLQTLPTGRLVLTAHYLTVGGYITHRIPLRRFINDMPIEYLDPTPAERAIGDIIAKRSSKLACV